MGKGMTSRFTWPLALLPLSACASQPDGGYPSLTRRVVEPAPSPAPTGLENVPVVRGEQFPSGPELSRRVAELEQQAEKGEAQFTAAYGKASEVIRGARSASATSERWVVAQVELAALERARYDSVLALTNLDGLYAAWLTALFDGGSVNGGDEDILLARAKAEVIVKEQSSKMKDLRSALALP